jgi:hypothetical protein
MHEYLKIQETHLSNGVLPWEVIADEDGEVTVPSSLLKMKRVVGFQKDADVQQVDLWWSEAYADPSKAVGMYVVTETTDGKMQHGMSQVTSAEIVDYPQPLPVER